ncbi:MAG: isocitrate lyase/phosphoenolpyruvate mutase family protein [Chitinophagaceae bacterium]|nr:isocitrate lyase/phosphoenolpyruvate mutase family protein [Rubrivivax sp.]
MTSPNRPSTADKRHQFQRLHERGCFVIPNPWDLGSALALHSLGFQALATTSAGLAWSLGRPDNGITRELVLAHLHSLVAGTDLPINADFENGFGVDAAGVAESVRLAVDAGVAGLSIEDSTGLAAQPLFDIETAVERLRAARSAIDQAGADTLLVGRAECFFVGQPDIDQTLARIKAYAQAGADCLYAPGIVKREDIVAVVAAAAPKPVNLLLMPGMAFSLAELAEMGVRRVSVGASLARAAGGGFMQAARALAGEGNCDGLVELNRQLAQAAPGRELNALFQPAR